MKTLYLSGPMKGLPESNYPAFVYGGRQLADAGYAVENPINNGLGPDLEWEVYLRADIAMVLRCDGVAVLPDWENSSGAALEVHIARSLKMPVRTLDRWLELSLD